MANYATIKTTDIANGPGVRVSVFLSGCTHKCPGCFNQELWDFNYGQDFNKDTILDIVNALRPDFITGLSVLGGDPFDGEDNRAATNALVHIVKDSLPDKTIWVYTGDVYENVKHLPAMQYIDVLVDGPFVESKKNLMLKFRGSTNQRIINVKESQKQNKIVLVEGLE